MVCGSFLHERKRECKILADAKHDKQKLVRGDRKSNDDKQTCHYGMMTRIFDVEMMTRFPDVGMMTRNFDGNVKKSCHHLISDVNIIMTFVIELSLLRHTSSYDACTG